MRVFIALAFLVISFAVLIQAEDDEANIAANEKSAQVSLSRYRRQVDGFDTPKCYKLQELAKCASSFAQRYVILMSYCGERGADEIRNTAIKCRQNEDGQYCGEAITPNDRFSVSLICPSQNSECSTKCRAALLKFKNEAGCCVTLWFSELFQMCRIALPERCESPDLTAPRITQDFLCDTEVEFQERKQRALCSYRHPITYALRTELDMDCYSYASMYDRRCTSKDGRYCFELLDAFNSSSASQKSLQMASDNCRLANNCSSQCKNSLIEVTKNVGCCLRSVNSSRDLYMFDNDDFLDSAVWEQCGMERPGSCYRGGTIFLAATKYWAFAVAMVIAFYEMLS